MRNSFPKRDRRLETDPLDGFSGPGDHVIVDGATGSDDDNVIDGDVFDVELERGAAAQRRLHILGAGWGSPLGRVESPSLVSPALRCNSSTITPPRTLADLTARPPARQPTACY
jgi:hypothetical protein